jgi:hypothetical protein
MAGRPADVVAQLRGGHFTFELVETGPWLLGDHTSDAVFIDWKATSITVEGPHSTWHVGGWKTALRRAEILLFNMDAE